MIDDDDDDFDQEEDLLPPPDFVAEMRQREIDLHDCQYSEWNSKAAMPPGYYHATDDAWFVIEPEQLNSYTLWAVLKFGNTEIDRALTPSKLAHGVANGDYDRKLPQPARRYGVPADILDWKRRTG